MTDSSPSTPQTPLVVLFDGDCGLCDTAVRFILKRDPHRRFRFAPLQSPIARNLLAPHGIDPDDLSSVVLIDGDRAYVRSNAALRIALDLPEPWPLAGVLSFIPEFLRDEAYNFIARHRKQWFKPPDACRTPTDQEREQFLAD
jgi:predicted DCC family thiol-disulfide oxidoreductase YuxK